jgi:hypothetical protein
LRSLGIGRIWTYPDVVFQLDSPGRIKFNILQCLADHIIRLTFACLRGFDGSSLVNVPLVVNIELAEGVGEAKDVVLLELRKFPAREMLEPGMIEKRAI